MRTRMTTMALVLAACTPSKPAGGEPEAEPSAAEPVAEPEPVAAEPVPTEPVAAEPVAAAPVEPTPGADADPPKKPVVDPKAVDEACAALAKRSAEVLAAPAAAMAKAASGVEVEPFVGRIGVCHRGAGGAWALEAMDMDTHDTGEADPTSLRMEGAVQLVHIEADGTLVRREMAYLAQLNEYPDLGDEMSPQILATHDYDHDGVDEVIVQLDRSGYDLDAHEARVHTVLDADAGRYVGEPEGLFGVEYETVTDYDGDGVYEVVSERTFWSAAECFGMGDAPALGNPAVLYHADPGGTFSATDAVAQAYLRERCPEPPKRLIVGGDYEWELEAKQRIACARLWGQSAQRVIERIGEEWPKLSAEDRSGERSCKIPRSELEETARIDPPVVLTR